MDPVTWTHWAISPEMQLLGGFARGFASSADVAANILPVDSDALVVMVGTNDLAAGQTSAVLSDIDRIVETVGARQVLVTTVPPFAPNPQAAATHNENLRVLALDREWGFVDPWKGVRAGDRWIAEFTFDGVHPTEAGGRLAGSAISEAIRALASTR